MRRGAWIGVAVLAILLGGCDGEGEGAGRSACPTGPSVPADAGYRGALFDTRTVLAEPGLPGFLACAMEAYGVEHAVLTVRMDPDDTFATESAYRAAVTGSEATFLPFLRVERPTRARLERVLNEVGLFFPGVWASDLARFPDDAFELAATRDLFVAAASVSKAVLDAHADVKVLLVADEPPAGLADLVRAHRSLFVTIVAPTRARFDEWFPVIQAGPDRVMWGSGASSSQDATPEAYGRVVAGARAFIERLPQPMRAPFAAGNARRLMGVPSPPQPDV